jgi:membrane protease YdiL (CAAX protease family)
VCALSALLGAVLQIPITAVDNAIERRWPTPPAELAERVARLIPHSRLQAVGIVAVVVLLGPLVEELFFRGALFGRMVRSRGVRPAALAVSACFVLAHGEVKEALPLFLVALALAEVRAVSGSLWPGFLLHGAFNGVTLALAFRGKLPGGQSADLPARLVLVGTAVSLALGYLLLSLALSSELAQKARSDDQAAP